MENIITQLGVYKDRIKGKSTTKPILFVLDNFRLIPNPYPVQTQSNPTHKLRVGSGRFSGFIAPEFYTKNDIDSSIINYKKMITSSSIIKSQKNWLVIH